MEGVAREFNPRVRGKEGGAREEFDIVATLETHGEEGLRMRRGETRWGSYTPETRDG